MVCNMDANWLKCQISNFKLIILILAPWNGLELKGSVAKSYAMECCSRFLQAPLFANEGHLSGREAKAVTALWCSRQHSLEQLWIGQDSNHKALTVHGLKILDCHKYPTACVAEQNNDEEISAWKRREEMSFNILRYAKIDIDLQWSSRRVCLKIRMQLFQSLFMGKIREHDDFAVALRTPFQTNPKLIDYTDWWFRPAVEHATVIMFIIIR